MTLLYLYALCLYMAGIHLDVVGSDMCDDGWVYYSNTKSCLQAIKGVNLHDFLMRDRYNPCRNKTGGEFRNISGQVVEFTEAIEPFLRNYLQFMKVPEAEIALPSYWLRHSLFKYNRYTYSQRPIEAQRTYFVPGKSLPFQGDAPGIPPIICQVNAGPLEPPVCPRDVKLVSVSDRNATLSWRPGQLGRKVVVYVTVQICDVPSSCSNFTSITFGDVSLFQQMNYTVAGLQPNTMYTIALQIQNDTFGIKDCNVTLSLTTNEAPPVCPHYVTLVSVSDRNVMLSLSPGQLGIRSITKIEIHLCVELSCEYFTSRIFEEEAPNQLMYYTVSGLQPNTKYKLVLQMLNDTFETKDCNMTLALQTNEESSAAVVGLAIMFSISLIACSVMAFLLFRYYRQAQKDSTDKDSDIDKIVAKVMKQASSKQETKLQETKLQQHESPEPKSTLYLNVQVEPHEYEKPTETQDDHIYEG